MKVRYVCMRAVCLYNVLYIMNYACITIVFLNSFYYVYQTNTLTI